tara:strand:+ start:2453 stop:2626 length:174 start_codon:yes stop_codon:yes gene_type:complete
MDTMSITNAQHDGDNNRSIKCTIDGVVCHVPLDPANRHYAEILKQVADGTLTIKDAD